MRLECLRFSGGYSVYDLLKRVKNSIRIQSLEYRVSDSGLRSRVCGLSVKG